MLTTKLHYHLDIQEHVPNQKVIFDNKKRGIDIGKSIDEYELEVEKKIKSNN